MDSKKLEFELKTLVPPIMDIKTIKKVVKKYYIGNESLQDIEARYPKKKKK